MEKLAWVKEHAQEKTGTSEMKHIFKINHSVRLKPRSDSRPVAHACFMIHLVDLFKPHLSWLPDRSLLPRLSLRESLPARIILGASSHLFIWPDFVVPDYTRGMPVSQCTDLLILFKDEPPKHRI